MVLSNVIVDVTISRGWFVFGQSRAKVSAGFKGVRAGGARGAAAPPKVWATQIFWAARENLGKASF